MKNVGDVRRELEAHGFRRLDNNDDFHEVMKDIREKIANSDVTDNDKEYLDMALFHSMYSH